MKFMSILIAVLFVTGSAFALDYEGDEKEKKKDKEMVLNVSGMTCGSCENRVSTELRKLKGVKDVKASHSENTVRLVLDDEHASDEEFKKAIKEAGFEVKKDGEKKDRKKKRDKQYE